MQQSRFLTILNELKSIVTLDKASYFVHTSVGLIQLGRIHVLGSQGIVVIQGTDQSGQFRCISFTEETLVHFPVEVRRRIETVAREPIGFLTKRDTEVIEQ
jgi:hypothetical protein